jgi:glucan phosphoethanolaminetransferase (alkaline phosphatase superfamily)
MEEIQEPKQRHLFVTLWLMLLIIVNSLAILTYLLLPNDLIFKYLRNTTTNDIFEHIIIAFINILFVIILLKWKKWGFWGFTITALINSIISYNSSHSTFVLIGGLVGILMLYAVLQTRKNNVSAWKNLE